MLFHTIKLELKIADKAYQFLCDNNSPLEHVKEALVQMLTYAQRVEEQIKEQQAQAAAEQETKEAPKPDISPEQQKEAVSDG